jgi:Ca-activated chloride channel family protein
MNSDKQVTVSTRWDNELVPAGKCSQRNLLIEVEAPPKPESLAPRPPINLALVIDRSGSMGGERIDAARLAASGIAEALSDKDRLSLVVFDEEVEALLDG